MHPNAFLRTFWQMEVKPQIFVAMSFAPDYRARYKEVIEPAISSICLNGTRLTPYRVDISKSGDSILTDIMEGVSHSQMVLADVSSVGKDSKTGESYRNGNVMYEVGLALACRHPSDVLLIRDDKDKFLFDVSTVPHMHLDFADTKGARDALHAELQARLKEQDYTTDARVKMAVASLSSGEVNLLGDFLGAENGLAWTEGGPLWTGIHEARLECLLDKRLIALTGRHREGLPLYKLTYLGRIVAGIVKCNLPLLGQDRAGTGGIESLSDERPKSSSE